MILRTADIFETLPFFLCKQITEGGGAKGNRLSTMMFSQRLHDILKAIIVAAYLIRTCLLHAKHVGRFQRQPFDLGVEPLGCILKINLDELS